jgi:addiction module HigA family antidote
MEDRLPNIHPGEILKEDFLDPLGVSAYRLAKETGMSQTRVGQIIRGKRGITADTALRFGKFFGTSARVWINLQTAYDIEETLQKTAEEIESIHPLSV